MTAKLRVKLHSKSVIVEDIPGFVREGADPGNPHHHTLSPKYADADLTAEEAGRLCYLSNHRPNAKTANNADYLLNICHQRHYSVLGHSFASIYVDGVSRNETHEKIRHKWLTYSEVSQRYVDVGEFEFVEHPGLSHISDFSRSKIAESFESAKTLYDVLVDELVNDQGLSRKEARQAARGVLPGGIETKILVSGNLRAWRDFLAQRLPLAADLEIRLAALKIFKIMKREFPNSFQDFDSRGLITTERLVTRARDRYKTAEAMSCHPRKEFTDKYVQEIDNILDQGLWVLKDDPWTEEEI